MSSSSLKQVPGTLHDHLEDASSHYNYFETNLTDNKVSKRVRMDEIISTNPDIHEYSEILRKGAIFAIVGSFSAINFGMDESAVGGAQLQYIKKFNIIDANVQGTINAAPYLAAGTLGTVSTVLLDQVLGRRAIIFISALFGIRGSL